MRLVMGCVASVLFHSLALCGTDPRGETLAACSFAWTPVSKGVQYTQDSSAIGTDLFLGFGGWTVQPGWATTWITALDSARLHALGVRHLYAIMGPKDADYASREIETTALARHIVNLVSTIPTVRRIIVAAHSSGAYVAHEFFYYMYDSAAADSHGVTFDKILYFNLDGGIGNGGSGFPISQTIANRLGHIFAVYATDGNTGISSPNRAEMQQLGGLFGAKSQQMQLWVNGSGCTGQWCVHETLINLRPHKTNTYDLQNDYTDFGTNRPVSTGYLDFLTSTKDEQGTNVAPEFNLQQNYPNPFNPTTTVRFTIGGVVAPIGIYPERSRGGEDPAAAHVRLSVYDMLGREVAVLANERMKPGSYSVAWNAIGMASGIYVYRMTAGDRADSRAMLLLK
jgi:hypothetical protein